MSRQDTPPEDSYLLSVCGCDATGVSYCAEVTQATVHPPYTRDACVVEVVLTWDYPAVQHRIQVQGPDFEEPTKVGVVRILSDGPVPWDLDDGKSPVLLPISRQLEWRAAMFKGQLGETQLADKVREYAEEYRGRVGDAEQLVAAGPPQHQGPSQHEGAKAEAPESWGVFLPPRPAQ